MRNEIGPGGYPIPAKVGEGERPDTPRPHPKGGAMSYSLERREADDLAAALDHLLDALTAYRDAGHSCRVHCGFGPCRTEHDLYDANDAALNVLDKYRKFHPLPKGAMNERSRDSS